MTLVTRFTLAFSLMVSTLFCHAQPAPSSTSSAKEQRQATGTKDKARPDRSQADAKQLKSAQKEAKDSQNRKMDAANAEMNMGVSSAGGSQVGAKGSAKKIEKHNAHKDAVKKPVQQR
jgi:hypothetical protein